MDKLSDRLHIEHSAEKGAGGEQLLAGDTLSSYARGWPRSVKEPSSMEAYFVTFCAG